MRLIVDDLPRTPKECLFGWKHLEYSKWRCKFGGECELSAECRQCSHLATFATDTNVATKVSTNLAEVGTDCISRQAAIDALKEHRVLYCDNTPDAFSKLSHAEKSRVDELDTAIATLVNLPPIQPKRGKWIEDKGQQTLMQNFIERGEVWRVCSVCGAGHMIGHKYECDKAYHETHHNFCPNCGAKMEVTT